MKRFPYERGVVRLSDGVYAFLFPDGSWGRNNAGLITDQGESLVVDTLFDPAHTRLMLDEYRECGALAGPVSRLVITHANGDHWYGSELFPEAEIIATRACAREMEKTPPGFLADTMSMASHLGGLGAFFSRCFSEFDFSRSRPRKPTRLFEGELEIRVGRKTVRLVEAGPAHTQSDLLVFVEPDDIVFAGDILFYRVTPVLWEGPLENWMAALDRLLASDAKLFVPGHGPVCGKEGPMAVKGYFQFIQSAARAFLDAGVDEATAARKLMGKPFPAWVDPERSAINLGTVYRHLSGNDRAANVPDLFLQMARLAGFPG
ncbi:MAG: MBL fold metallo-hydrolase [Thermodesulfobacteriota bacterium]